MKNKNFPFFCKLARELLLELVEAIPQADLCGFYSAQHSYIPGGTQ